MRLFKQCSPASQCSSTPNVFCIFPVHALKDRLPGTLTAESVYENATVLMQCYLIVNTNLFMCKCHPVVVVTT